MEIYLISSTKYKTYRAIQMDSLGLYFAELIILSTLINVSLINGILINNTFLH